MKKHLIAAAVAAAVAVPAMAQNVEIYGILDQAMTTNKTDTKGASSTLTDKVRTTGAGGAYTTQRLGFRGTEDLGGGLKATFNYEVRLAGQDSEGDSGRDSLDPDSVRQMNIGLSGSFGTVRFGRMTTLIDGSWAVGNSSGQNNFTGTLYNTAEASSAAGNWSSSEADLALRLSNARSDRLIEYISPNLNGFTFGIQHGKRTNDDENGGIAATSNAYLNTAYRALLAEVGSAPADIPNVGKVTHSELGLRANYSQGPLNVSLGYVKEKAKAGSIDVFAPKQTVIGANYNFGVARAFFTYTDASDEYLDVAKVDIDGYELGAAMPLGAVTLQGSFFRADYKAKIGGASGKADIDGYQLSALYSMSKRTTLYAVYGGTDTDYGRTRVGDRDSTEYGIGVRHSF